MANVVVVYHSGYGHTQRMAQSVAEGAGAELLAIDAEGNLIYRMTARNFNPMMATAGKISVAEVGGDHADREMKEFTAGNAMLSVLAVVASFIVGGILIAVSSEDVQTTLGYITARPSDFFNALWNAVFGAYDAMFRGAIFNYKATSFTMMIKPITETINPGRWIGCGGVFCAEVAIVHNGIIENFKELRAELAAKGRVFESETDSEVVAHLISAEVEAGAVHRDGPTLEAGWNWRQSGRDPGPPLSSVALGSMAIADARHRHGRQHIDEVEDAQRVEHAEDHGDHQCGADQRQRHLEEHAHGVNTVQLRRLVHVAQRSNRIEGRELLQESYDLLLVSETPS